MTTTEKEALRKILVALFLESPRRITTQARGAEQQNAKQPTSNIQSVPAPEPQGETHGR